MKWISLLIHIHNVFNKKSSCSEPSVASGLHYYACLAKDCYFMILFLWHMMMYVDRKFPMQKRLKKGPLLWQVLGSIRKGFFRQIVHFVLSLFWKAITAGGNQTTVERFWEFRDHENASGHSREEIGHVSLRTFRNIGLVIEGISHLYFWFFLFQLVSTDLYHGLLIHLVPFGFCRCTHCLAQIW